jgi:hypothetical protein
VDAGVTVIRALIAAIPFVGGSITEAWAGFFSSPLARRREGWLRDLALTVADVQREMPNLTPESLQNNDQFISAVLSATVIAVRTHRKEKLHALRNAAVSSLLNPDIDEDLQEMFMRYVDDFTPWHLRVLQAFHDPNGHFRQIGSPIVWLADRNGTLWSSCKAVHTFMYEGFPELASQVQFLDTVLHDVGVRHLIPVQKLFHEALPDVGPYTTLTGVKFMRFIGAGGMAGEAKT